jgi:hypothetical protein
MNWFGPTGDCGCCPGDTPCEVPTGCDCATGVNTRSTAGTATIVVTGSAISHPSTIAGCTSPTLCQSMAGTYYQDCLTCTRYDLQEYVCFDSGGLPGFQYIYYWQAIQINHLDAGNLTISITAGYRQLGTPSLGYGVTAQACGTLIPGFQLHSRLIEFSAPSIEYCTDEFGNYGCTGTFSVGTDTTTTSGTTNHCEPNYSFAVSR